MSHLHMRQALTVACSDLGRPLRRCAHSALDHSFAVAHFARISASDWAPGGWDIDESVALSRDLAAVGCDLIDVSSGGLVRTQQIPIGPHYQVPFAERIRAEAHVATGAVGLITDPHEANGIIERGQADLVLLARELLRNPYWPLHAATALGVDVKWPPQYSRAKPTP